jgi:glyoxylase-like metal-dependent hydrolase (beta-lactamase superfamily II)
VWSYAYDAGDTLVLLDPLFPPPEAEELAEEKDTVVLLTCAWHARSASYVRAPVYAPEPGELAATAYGVGDSLPGGLVAREAFYPGEASLWIPAARALMVGESLLGWANGRVRTPPDTWLPEGMTREDFKARLHPLLELPIEFLLLAHGPPIVDRARGRLSRTLAA